MASNAAEKTTECGEMNSFVKRERQPTPEAMDTNNNNNRDREGGPTGRAAADIFQLSPESRTAPGAGGMRNQPHFSSFAKQQQQQQQQGPGQVNSSSNLQTAAAGRQASAEFPGRRTSAEILRSLISPECSQTGTPTSLSQLIPSAFSLEGNEFGPVESRCFSPQNVDRMARKRALSISPSSSSSLDLTNLIRTSPTSLVNYITNSRGSSAGSFGHLSPSLYSSIHQQAHGHAHGRPMQVSLRNGNYPINTNTGHHSFTHQQSSDLNGVQVKKEMESSPPSQTCSNMSGMHHQSSVIDPDMMKMEDIRGSFFENTVSVKMEPGMHDNAFMPPPLISMGTRGLETVQEEPGLLPSEEEDLMHSDPTDYSAMLNGNECVYETKLGIIENIGDPDKQKKRIYYTYPTVEDPHNNQCRWNDCSMQCEDLDSLVQHVNTDHIYRDSKKEFVCHWTGCVREKKPFKAQYMLLVHMRRHTGEKPHKCTVSVWEREGGRVSE